MIVYCQDITPRIEYIFDFVLKDVLDIKYKLTSDLNTFHSSTELAKWVYGEEKESYLSLFADKLLFEDSIEPKTFYPKKIDEITPLFFDSEGERFDVLASIFYLITRYEEYLPCVLDKHGRYASYQSIAVQEEFLDKLMVNRYIDWFQNWLYENGLINQIKLFDSKLLMTVDIDHPFYAKNISLGKQLLRRFKTIGEDTSNDKYDTFSFITSNIDKQHLLFFWLCPETHSEQDGYHRRESEDYKNLLHSESKNAEYGIHPSYYAESQKTIEGEIDWLEKNSGVKIEKSRMHYLRVNIETTYKSLIKSKIKDDYSMMYGTDLGWRTSTSFPYYFFDLKKNKKTSLVIHTPCFMDSIVFYDNKKTYSESQLDSIISETKKYGGEFIPIFHNDILADDKMKYLFTKIIKSFS